MLCAYVPIIKEKSLQILQKEGYMGGTRGKGRRK